MTAPMYHQSKVKSYNHDRVHLCSNKTIMISCIPLHICLSSYSGRKLYRFLQGLSCFEFITISAFWKILKFELIKAKFFISWERWFLSQNLYVILNSNTAIIMHFIPYLLVSFSGRKLLKDLSCFEFITIFAFWQVSIDLRFKI